MKSLLIFLTILVFTPIYVNAQAEYSTNLQVGWGSYSMSELKDFQNYIEKQWSIVNLKKINNFPSYTYYNFQLSRSFNKNISLGIDYRLQSTGYKSSYKDYSGEIKLEQVVWANQAGMSFILPINIKSKKVTLSFPLKIYYSWTTCNLDYIITISGQTVDSFKRTFISNSIMANPEINCYYSIIEPLQVGIVTGFNLDFKGDLKLKDHKDIKLQLNNETVQSNWTGYRIGLIIQYKFIQGIGY